MEQLICTKLGNFVQLLSTEIILLFLNYFDAISITT